METKKLYRSNDRVLGGVCAGLANYFDFDVTAVRAAYALLTFFTAFSGIPCYIILWIIMPERK
jgi:phage shock protein PspC (stress-responsive transcriptional regulator)